MAISNHNAGKLPEKPLILGECAWFSTEGRRYPLRVADNSTAVVIHHDFDADAVTWAFRLRQKWPHICADIFMEATDPIDIRWYFDHWDFHVQGGAFLFKVLQTLAMENREMLVAFCSSWSVKNAAAFGPFACTLPNMTVDQLFAEPDLQRYGPYFLARARTRMQAAWNISAIEFAKSQTLPDAALVPNALSNGSLSPETSFSPDMRNPGVRRSSHPPKFQSKDLNGRGRGQSYTRAKPYRRANRSNSGSGHDMRSFQSPVSHHPHFVPRPQYGFVDHRRSDSHSESFGQFHLQHMQVAPNGVPQQMAFGPPTSFPVAQGWIPHAGIHPLGFIHGNAPMHMYAAPGTTNSFVPGIVVYPGANAHGTDPRYAPNGDGHNGSREAHSEDSSRSAMLESPFRAREKRGSVDRESPMVPWQPPAMHEEQVLGQTQPPEMPKAQPERSRKEPRQMNSPPFVIANQHDRSPRTRKPSFSVTKANRHSEQTSRRSSDDELTAYHIPTTAEFSHIRSLYIQSRRASQSESRIVSAISGIVRVVRARIAAKPDADGSPYIDGTVHFETSQDASKVLKHAKTLFGDGVSVFTPRRYLGEDHFANHQARTRQTSRRTEMGSVAAGTSPNAKTKPTDANDSKAGHSFSAQDARSDLFKEPNRSTDDQSAVESVSVSDKTLSERQFETSQLPTLVEGASGTSQTPKQIPPVKQSMNDVKTWAKIAARTEQTPKTIVINPERSQNPATPKSMKREEPDISAWQTPVSATTKPSTTKEVSQEASKHDKTSSSKQPTLPSTTAKSQSGRDVVSEAAKGSNENQSSTLAANEVSTEEITSHSDPLQVSTSAKVLPEDVTSGAMPPGKAAQAKVETIEGNSGLEKDPAKKSPSAQRSVGTIRAGTTETAPDSSILSKGGYTVQKKKPNKKKKVKNIQIAQPDSKPTDTERHDSDLSLTKPKRDTSHSNNDDKKALNENEQVQPLIETALNTSFAASTLPSESTASLIAPVAKMQISQEQQIATPDLQTAITEANSSADTGDAVSSRKLITSPVREVKSNSAVWKSGLEKVKVLIGGQADQSEHQKWSEEISSIAEKLHDSQTRLDAVESFTGSMNIKKRQKLNRTRAAANEAITNLQDDLTMLESRILAAKELKSRGYASGKGKGRDKQDTEEFLISPFTPPERSVTNFLSLQKDVTDLRHQFSRGMNSEEWIRQNDSGSIDAIIQGFKDGQANPLPSPQPRLQFSLRVQARAESDQSDEDHEEPAKIAEANTSESVFESDPQQLEALSEWKPMVASAPSPPPVGLGISTPAISWASVVGRNLPNTASKSPAPAPAVVSTGFEGSKAGSQIEPQSPLSMTPLRAMTSSPAEKDASSREDRRSPDRDAGQETLLDFGDDKGKTKTGAATEDDDNGKKSNSASGEQQQQLSLPQGDRRRKGG